MVKTSVKIMSKCEFDRTAFIRKEEVGDWDNYFSEGQSKFVDAKCKEYLEPLGVTSNTEKIT